MAWYYVKSGGTATGDAGRYTTQQTGSFAGLGASGYYDNIAAALSATTAPTISDFIFVSDAHDHDYAVSQTINGGTASAPIPCCSVSDTAIDQYSSGAIERGSDFTITDIDAHGISFISDDDFFNLSDGGATAFNDATIKIDGNNGRFFFNKDGAEVVFNGCDVEYGHVDCVMTVQNCNSVTFIGGALAGVSGVNYFLRFGGINGGMKVHATGFDLTNVTGTLLGDVGNSGANDDLIDVRFDRCKLNASTPTFANETFSSPNHILKLTNCSGTSSAAEYQFFQRTWAGDVEDQDDSGIHRDESTAFDGGEKVSFKCTTLSTASLSRPLVFDLPARFAELSAASTDTVRIYFAVVNTVTLTNTNCWAEVIYPDGTTKNLFNVVSNRNSDILATGTTHTDDSSSSTWKNGASDLTGYNEYRMDIDTSGDPGADGVTVIRIYLAEPSVTVYFDTTVDLVA
jgi:hypothetical protein